MIGQTILLIWVLAISHFQLGESSFREVYISEIKETELWYWGYAAFALIVLHLVSVGVSSYWTRSYGFAWLYSAAAALTVGLMATPAMSTFHLALYVALIFLVVCAYWIFLWRSDQYIPLAIFIALLVAILFVLGPRGAPVFQKGLLAYFILIVNLHHRANCSLLRAAREVDEAPRSR